MINHRFSWLTSGAVFHFPDFLTTQVRLTEFFGNVQSVVLHTEPDATAPPQAELVPLTSEAEAAMGLRVRPSIVPPYRYVCGCVCGRAHMGPVTCGLAPQGRSVRGHIQESEHNFAHGIRGYRYCRYPSFRSLATDGTGVPFLPPNSSGFKMCDRCVFSNKDE